MTAPGKRPWSVRLNAEADRILELANQWPSISLHASNHLSDAVRSVRRAAEAMAKREQETARAKKRKVR